MEVFKIKISPEVLRRDITETTYSADTFGYYSGLTKYLSQTKVTEYYYRRTAPTFPGGFLVLLGDFTEPVGYDGYEFIINQFSLYGQDTSSFFQTLKIGQKITVILEDDSVYEYFLHSTPVREVSSLTITLQLISINSQLSLSVPNNQTIIFNIIQENVSLFDDMSIPILLKQDYEDVGYYSTFDGELSQFIEDVNFTFTNSLETPYDICVYNTSNYNLSYLQEATYNISWGDGTPVEEATIFIPETICHTYPNDGETTTYSITLTGQTQIGSYVVTKTVTIPFTSTISDNPYGTVTFLSNNGSWLDSPSSQNYYYEYDSNNTVDYQISENFVDVPFILSGYTQSKLSDLASYGPTKYRNDLIINLADGTTGMTLSQSPEYTAYTINGQTFIDFSAGTSIFIVESSGLTRDMIVASGITKLEYLMNVIEQPIIQSNVFMDRGKYSGLENFRRFGEVGNIGALVNYGYKFFDVKNYNEV